MLIFDFVFFSLFLTVGLCIGSFLNVVIYRIPVTLLDADRNAFDSTFNIAWPPSHCFNCKTKIRWRDNIPVLSWLFLKGKCRSCGSVISSRYPLTELICGLVFALTGSWLVISYDQNLLVTLPFLFIFSICYCLASIDFEHLLLPDNLVFTLLWAGLCFSVSGLGVVSIEEGVIGVVVTWSLLTIVLHLFIVIRKKEGLGSGDVKLYSALGAWVGWQQLPLLLALSAALGLVMFLLFKKHTINDLDSESRIYTVIPFGPAITLAGVVIYMYLLNQKITMMI